MEETQTETTAPKAEIPDWAKETPDGPTYYLEMCCFACGGDDPEQIELSRDEYIELKRHLAPMRGYEVEDEEPVVMTVAGEPEAEPDSDLSEALETVRLIYERNCGCITPAEDLISSLIGIYGAKGGLDLTHVEMGFDEFRGNWKDALSIVRMMNKQYPDFLATLEVPEQPPAA